MLGDGTIVYAGGKVVKNVAGYDLGKLVCGSRGAGVHRTGLPPLAPAPACRAHGRRRDDRPAGCRAVISHSQLVPSALDVLHPGRVAVLFEGGDPAVATQVAATRSLVGGAKETG